MADTADTNPATNGTATKTAKTAQPAKIIKPAKATTVAAPTTDKPQQANWFAIIAVAVGIFTLVTTELLPVGLLTPIGAELAVKPGIAGLMVTVPGLVAAVAAPLVTVGTSRLDRRLVLATLIGFMVIANAISAITPHFALMVASRVLVGVTIGGFWAIAGSLGSRLAPPHLVARSTAIIFSGIAVASVLGVPAATLLGQLAGWRSAFAVFALLGLVVLIALITLLPKLPTKASIRPIDLARRLRHPGVAAGVLATMLIVTGHFAGYTFVRPVAEQISHLPTALISTILLVYGVAGITGNFLAGAAVARNVRRTLQTLTIVLAAAMLLMPILGTGPIGGVALLIVWGLGYGGVSVTVQTWMLKVSPDAPEAASALLVAMFNFSIALGALVGGIAVDSISTVSVLWLGGILVLATSIPIWLARRAKFS